MLIACVKTGTKYGDEYVYKLRDGIKRHCSRDFEFVCLSDTDIDGVARVPLVQSNLKGWWAKLELFKIEKPLLYFDLDMAVTGDVARAWNWDGFGILEDPVMSTFNSSVMKLTGNERHVWDQFHPRFMDMVDGDQDYITGVMAGKANPYPREYFPSYKVDKCIEAVPAGAIAVNFNGFPKPHQITSGWVHDYWNGLGTHAPSTPEGTKLYGGFLWPAHDQSQIDAVWGELPNLDKIIDLVPNKGIAVQAGGNVGVFAKRLAKDFTTVVTFEPDRKNFECLEKNVPETNVAKIRSALGADGGSCHLETINGNSGMTRVRDVHYGSSCCDVDMQAIDDLSLSSCDLIYLDIEGFELEALKGAAKTIARCKPTVVVEENGMYRRYSDCKPSQWLIEQFDYEIVARLGRDVVLQSGE